MDTSPPSMSYMLGIARRIAPARPQAWDDMVQEGYELWIRSAAKYDPSYGVPAKRFIYPIIEHQMRRAMRRDAAVTLGTSLSSLQRGGGTERRVFLDEERHPDGIESLSAHDAATPEELVSEAQMTWQARRALWRAAEEMEVSSSPWRYAFMRDCILTERVRYTDMLERYGKRPGSLNFFRTRLLARAQELA
jgi:DNA-directed RNA polymerase specialized sigma24 family protein